MATMDEIRAGVRKSVPEIEMIKDEGLRNKVVEAWAVALSETEWASLDEMPGAPDADRDSLESSTQGTHIRAVAAMSWALADAFERVASKMPLDRDQLLAIAILHDVGKPYEWSKLNRDRWKSDIPRYGFPAFRHPAYGAHIALSVGLPEEIASGIAAHCAEGECLSRNLAGTIVHMCDHGYWDIASRAGLLGDQVAGKFTVIAGKPEVWY